MTLSTTTTGDVISSDKVEGTSVYNNTGDKLGSIDDLMIDKRTGQVRYAVMKFGGFLGIDTDRYPIPWNMLKYPQGWLPRAARQDQAAEGAEVPV